MDGDELSAWLRLTTTPGLSRSIARQLLAHFGTPQAVVAQVPGALREHLDASTLQAWTAGRERHEVVLSRTLDWLAQAPDDAPRQVLTLGDPDYPPAWLDAPDPPLCLYLVGQVKTLRRPALAMVGSRHPTPQGREHAHAFAAGFSQAGLVVVSGLALGIDGAAHEGALTGPTPTVAIVGTGLDQVYPRAHQGLSRRITRDGAIVSEYPLGTPPLRENFPRRNRLIAGLGLGTLVVEATVQSGSLITARLAAEAGREVFAIPGSIHSPQSRGCHWLIRQGAKLVETAQDVLDELRPLLAANRPSQAHPARVAAPAAPLLPTPPDDPVLQALGHAPSSFDQLAARTGMPSARLQARLLELELEGRVGRLPGARYQRVASA